MGSVAGAAESLMRSVTEREQKVGAAERGQQQAEADLEKVSGWLLWAFFLGWVAVIIRMATTFHVGPNQNWAGTFQAFAWSLACVAGGFGTGFLFGIPKSTVRASATAVPDQGATSTLSHLRVNTNLEDISDWLTKVLVGATLTQVGKIPAAVRRASAFMAGGDLDKLGMSMYAAVLIYFSLLGFLAGYILTRLFFGRAFAIADQQTSTSRAVIQQTVVAETAKSATGTPGAGTPGLQSGAGETASTAPATA